MREPINGGPARGRRGGALLAVAVAALTLPAIAWPQRLVPTGDPAFPRIKYADSLESVNDCCIVRQAKLNPRVRPTYINGFPVGYC